MVIAERFTGTSVRRKGRMRGSSPGRGQLTLSPTSNWPRHGCTPPFLRSPIAPRHVYAASMRSRRSTKGAPVVIAVYTGEDLRSPRRLAGQVGIAGSFHVPGGQLPRHRGPTRSGLVGDLSWRSFVAETRALAEDALRTDRESTTTYSPAIADPRRRRFDPARSVDLRRPAAGNHIAGGPNTVSHGGRPRGGVRQRRPNHAASPCNQHRQPKTCRWKRAAACFSYDLENERTLGVDRVAKACNRRPRHTGRGSPGIPVDKIRVRTVRCRWFVSDFKIGGLPRRRSRAPPPSKATRTTGEVDRGSNPSTWPRVRGHATRKNTSTWEVSFSTDGRRPSSGPHRRQ